MKEYRLSSWPDLPAEYRHTRYQRVLHDMSQRFVSLKQLTATSSLRRGELRAFVRLLASQQTLHQRRSSTGVAATLARCSSRLTGLMSSGWRRLATR